MDLFDHHRERTIAAEAPLAARMRSRTLDEFVGQAAIVGPGRLLRRAIQADQLSSLIFYGPPGTGKTTLARIIANTTQAHFIAINAVLAGVKDLRDAIAIAQEKRGKYNQRTILFVDEVHRFNKSQQDALLPWVENGTVILIGATTENPYFEVNKALVSRSRVFQLKSLEAEDLRIVLQQALADPERGYGERSIHLDEDAIEHLVNIANGDARTLLNALELAVETTPATESGIHITLAVAEESIQQRAVLYDKEGDAHFDIISAFIKSIRGSDPDAALYWLARMVHAGEDPRFIFRRLVILASEDIGLADPQAVVVVNACAQAFDRVGMPEGRYPLAQATLYLATAPKSNSVMGFFDALAAVENERDAEPPNHLKDATRDKHSFGHGANYLYPHAYRDHWVAQQYLPTSLQGQVFYQPSDQGAEAAIQTQVAQRREAQLAAIVSGLAAELPEVLSFGPVNSTQDRWLQRTLSQTGANLADVRDRLFASVSIQRHHVILDLNAGSGLLTWEAVRRVPEGGVYAWIPDQTDATAIAEQSRSLPSLSRPIVLHCPLDQLVLQVRSASLQFDAIVGRNALMREPDKANCLHQWSQWLSPNGTIALAEAIPRRAQRLYAYLEPNFLGDRLYQQLIDAEEAIYTHSDDSMVNWDVEDLERAGRSADLSVQIALESQTHAITLSDAHLQRWFAQTGDRPTYAMHLAHSLTSDQIQRVYHGLHRLRHQSLPWTSTIVYLTAHR